MKKTEKINICFTTDDKYIEYCGVAIVSIILNSANDFHFYILHPGIRIKNKIKLIKLKKIKTFKLTFIKVGQKKFRNCYIPEKSHFNIINYFRIKIASLLPKIQKVIYLDSDIIANNDIANLWNIPFDDSLIIGCDSMVCDKNCERLGLPIGTTYINSGVMLMNLEKIRKNGIEDLFFQLINKKNIKALNVDQDIINVVLSKINNSIKKVSQNWNVEIRSDMDYFDEYRKFVKNPYIIHYITNDKPWNEDSKQFYKDKFLKYYEIAQKEYNKNTFLSLFNINYF